MSRNTIEFTPGAVQKYLDDAIRFWRNARDNGDDLAVYYIDVFQSVRSSLFGARLELEGERPVGDGGMRL